MGGGTTERGSRNVEPEGAFRGIRLFAGLSVQPAPARSGDRKFFGHGFGQLRSGGGGAKVTVTSQATNVSREATTDDTGHFLVPLLGVADYTIRWKPPGFKPAEAKDVRLQIDEHRELDFKLVPASVSTSVEVNATEVAVQTTNPTLGSGHHRRNRSPNCP